MDIAYDVLESAPYMLLSFISLVLLAMMLIVVAGILVTIPAYTVFVIYRMVNARNHKAVSPTCPNHRPELVAFALARERRPSSPAVAAPHEKKAA
jgi:hypothetical protein